ncbi:microfibril-associated glycoprotein 4-like isoform X2 [Diabrotica undecimpunctata]|uniref:microfibril-associated glycoprotein 4-like isoform X2 n=1 Tax=Diabrotica undecimpunctata TaxID=50387 RepID=UPI003B63CAE4
MNSLVIVLLLCGNLKIALSETPLPADPVNVKFTKLLDVKVEGRTTAWNDNLGRFMYQQPEEINIGTKEDYVQIPFKIALAVDKENKIQEYQNTITNLFDQCKYLVGRSKIPFCRLNPLTENSSKKTYPRSCREILESGNNKSGVYEIKPRTSSKPFSVLCDMDTDGGGWTHIQKRVDGSQDFYLPWRDYKFGFGDLSGEFWIGLENIYHMTAFEINELLIEITETNKTKSYAQYKAFSIGSEKDGYVLSELKGFSGNAGDSLTHHLNAKFTTLDVDQDKNGGNCAQIFEGAWWYVNCHSSNLNGKFMTVVLPKTYEAHGLTWHALRNEHVNLAGSRMLIRPIGE